MDPGKKRPGKFDGENFRSWFFQIARNKLIDFSRSPERRRIRSSIDEHDEHSVEDDPAEQLARNEELKALRDCMTAVGGEFVEVVRRNKVEGESPEQIASELGIDVATVYSRISRGKKKLQQCLEMKQK